MSRRLNEDSNQIIPAQSISLNEHLTNYQEPIWWTFTNVAPKGLKSFPLLAYTLSHSFVSWLVEKRNIDRYFGLPLIFSVSDEAIGILSEDTELKRAFIQMSERIGRLLLEGNVSAIGEVSTFQEDEEKPKVFITYAIMSKKYSEILKIWDGICEDLTQSIPVSSLQKIAIVLDQL